MSSKLLNPKKTIFIPKISNSISFEELCNAFDKQNLIVIAWKKIQNGVIIELDSISQRDQVNIFYFF